MLLCIEVMFISLSTNFMFISIYSLNEIGCIYALLILIMAASETAIGLSLIVLVHRLGLKADYSSLVSLRG